MICRRIATATLLLVVVEFPAQAANRTLVHTVEKGDTLWGLSKRTGCTVEQLRKANPSADTLRPGDKLELPECGNAVVTTPTRAATKSSTPDLSKLPPPPRGSARPRVETVVEDETPISTPSTVSAGGGRHLVARGDTVAKIARRYKVSEDAIRKLNDLSDRSMIIVGQSLALPGKPALELPKVRVVLGQSVGRPDRGKLVGGVQLPHDSAYFRRNPTKSYGTQHTVDHTRAAIRAVKHEYPRVHRVAIGDLSKPRGGPIQGHRSHQSGRDIDIGLYYKRPPSQYPSEFVKASVARVDLAATWKLVESLAAAAGKPGGPEYIFLDYSLQRDLYDYARSQGVSKAKLGEIFQYPHGRRNREGLVRHEPNHADHLHVRYSCPPKDAKCK